MPVGSLLALEVASPTSRQSACRWLLISALAAKVLQGRRKTMTILAAPRRDRVDTPRFIGGPIDGDSSWIYSGKFFCRPFDAAISSSWTCVDATVGARRNFRGARSVVGC